MKWLLLVLISTLAFGVRLVGLGSYPAGFTPDEAAFGYNAYSLLHTGQDEWGTPFWQLPFTSLRSFGDYKLPLYAFLAVPSVAIFGLNEAATRLPHVFLGALAIPLVYLLAHKLFGRYPQVAYLAALLLAISPWHLPLSRGAFEANLVTFFLSLSLVLFFSRRPLLTSFFLALSLYSYHTPRLIVPVILTTLLVFFRPPKIAIALITFVLLALPAAFSLARYNARSADLSIFNPADGWQAMASRRLAAIQSGQPAWLARLQHNKLTATLPVFFHNYFSYFTPKFLFQTGAGEATYGLIPGRGVLYLIELPFLLTFIYLLIKKPHKYFYLLLLLLLIAPVPAALAKGAGYAANRTAPMILPLVLMSAIGAGFWVKKFGRPFFLLLLLFLCLSFSRFAKTYVRLSPVVSPPAMGYGFSQAVAEVIRLAPDFTQVRFSRTLSEPHIYLAFYSRFSPRDYQLASISWREFETLGFKFLDQYDGYRLGKYRFGDLNFDQPASSPTLFVGRPRDFPPSVTPKATYLYPDSTPAIVLVENQLYN